jgi:organic radical activating enzyme
VKESWNVALFPPVSADEVARRASQCPAGAVVVTGGEPMLYNLGYLCDRLHSAGLKTYLETSGSQTLNGTWDWICLSPKKGSPPQQDALARADELKVIIFEKHDLEWAEENAAGVRQDCHLFLQPEWSRASDMMPVIVEYIKTHPQWRISLQSHKYMHIP